MFPFLLTGTVVTLSGGKTVQERPLLSRESKARLSDCGVNTRCALTTEADFQDSLHWLLTGQWQVAINLPTKPSDWCCQAAIFHTHHRHMLFSLHLNITHTYMYYRVIKQWSGRLLHVLYLNWADWSFLLQLLLINDRLLLLFCHLWCRLLLLLLSLWPRFLWLLSVIMQDSHYCTLWLSKA